MTESYAHFIVISATSVDAGKQQWTIIWCRWRESNPHSLRNTILSRARLPVPPHGHASANRRSNFNEPNLFGKPGLDVFRIALDAISTRRNGGAPSGICGAVFTARRRI